MKEVRHETVVKEIEKLMLAANWKMTSCKLYNDPSFLCQIKGFSVQRTLDARRFGLISVIDWRVSPAERSTLATNAGDGRLNFNPENVLYQIVKKEIELRREKQVLRQACKKLPEGVEKAKARRL